MNTARVGIILAVTVIGVLRTAISDETPAKWRVATIHGKEIETTEVRFGPGALGDYETDLDIELFGVRVPETVPVTDVISLDVTGRWEGHDDWKTWTKAVPDPAHPGLNKVLMASPQVDVKVQTSSGKTYEGRLQNCNRMTVAVPKDFSVEDLGITSDGDSKGLPGINPKVTGSTLCIYLVHVNSIKFPDKTTKRAK